MKMEKRKFRIGELAKQLAVERFVIRFWEKEFNLKSDRSTGGQRFYSENDLSLFESIKSLLYLQGFTISGAKQQLKELKQKKNTVIGSQKTTMHDNDHEIRELKKEKESLEQRVLILQKQLIKLRELL